MQNSGKCNGGKHWSFIIRQSDHTKTINSKGIYALDREPSAMLSQHCAVLWRHVWPFGQDTLVVKLEMLL